MKKFLLLFSVMLCVLSAGAQTSFTKGNLTYTVIGSTTNVIVQAANTSISGDIVIPETVTYQETDYTVTTINSNGFYNCKGITSVTIPANLVEMTEHQCYHNPYFANPMAWCSHLQTITVADGNTAFKVIDGVLFTTDEKTLLAYPAAAEGESYTVPDGVTALADGCFADATNLEEITLPESLVGLGDFTFEGCTSLMSLTIPAGVNLYGSDVVSDCTSLEYLYILNPDLFCKDWVAADLDDLSLCLPQNITICLNEANMSEETRTIVNTSLIERDIDVTEENIASPIITIGNLGYATYCYSRALDFTNADVKAYIVSAYVPSTGEVILTRINDVPKGTGFVVKGAAGDYEIPLGYRSIVLSNMLKGNLEYTDELEEENGYTNYILSNGDNGIGFYAMSDTELDANKAYLPLPSDKLPSSSSSSSSSGAPARGLRITFNEGDYDDVTGIVDVEDSRTQQGRGVCYNLSGQRVERPAKGIYIVDGKKVFIR